MPPVGSTTPPVCRNPDRIFIILRALQLFLAFAYLICIALTTTNMGRWSYASIEPAIGLGATGAMLTCLAAAVYFIAYKDILHPSNFQGPIKRVLYLLLRISIDLIISVFWLLAFFLSLFPKKTDFKNLFVAPPYKTWATSVVVAFIEFVLFTASDFMILVCYRLALGPATIVLAGNNLTATNQPPANRGTGSVRSAVSGTTTVTMTGNAVEPTSTTDGIELAPRVNVGTSSNRGGEMPSAGLTRSG